MNFDSIVDTDELHGIPVWRIRTPTAQAAISAHGGQLLSWQPTGFGDVLWYSPQTRRPPNAIRGGVRNNAGGHSNHSFFWTILGPGKGGAPKGTLAAAIDAQLGGFAKFKEDFGKAAATRFGSGWAWLAVKDGRITVMKTPNGENPLVHGAQPILGCDVWEHSYYIDYRNRRPDYLKAFLDNLVNWEHVDRMLQEATQKA